MKTLSAVFLTVVVLLSFGALVHSEESLSLDSLIQQAKEHNPEIIAAREKLKAAKARIGQEKTWENPDFFIDYRKMAKGNFSLSQAEEKEYGVTQMIPFPGKLTLKGRVAQSIAEKTAEEYRQTELTVLAQLKISYAMYFYIGKSNEVFKNILETMKIFRQAVEAKYVTGSATQSDVLRAQVEIAKILGMLTMVEQEKQTIQAELKALLGKAGEEKLPAPKEETPNFLEISWEETQKKALANSPLIKQARSDVAEKNSAKKLAKAGYLPDFGLTYRQRKMTKQMDSHDLMIGVSLPLWFWKQGFSVQEMTGDLKMAEADKKNIELITLAKAKEFFSKLQAGRQLIELYRTGILPPAEQSLKVSRAEYQAGRGSFLELLDSVRALLEFKLDYYKYISEYYQNLALLEKIAGTELEK